MTDFISIILPVFNGEKFLKEAVKSILSQTFPNFELIIIDDGSTDNSVEIIKSFNDDRIKLLSNWKNEGLIFSLNRGLSIVTGKYIARMDADDIAHPDRLKIQFEFMESNPDVDICGTWILRFGSLLRRGLLKLPCRNDEIKASLLFYNPLVHPSVIFKREFIVKNRLKYSNDFKGAEDYNMWVEMIASSAKTANIPESLLRYRTSDLSISGNIFFNQQRLEERFKLVSEIQRKLFIAVFPRVKFKPEIHSLIYKMKFHTEFLKIDDVKDIADWLNELKEFNRLSKYCDVVIFDKVIAEIFYDVCSKTTYIGTKLYKEFSGFSKFLTCRKYKLFCKCLIKWGYLEMLLKKSYLKEYGKK